MNQSKMLVFYKKQVYNINLSNDIFTNRFWDRLDLWSNQVVEQTEDAAWLVVINRTTRILFRQLELVENFETFWQLQ